MKEQQELINMGVELNNQISRFYDACIAFGLDEDTIETNVIEIIEQATNGKIILYR